MSPAHTRYHHRLALELLVCLGLVSAGVSCRPGASTPRPGGTGGASDSAGARGDAAVGGRAGATAAEGGQKGTAGTTGTGGSPGSGDSSGSGDSTSGGSQGETGGTSGSGGMAGSDASTGSGGTGGVTGGSGGTTGSGGGVATGGGSGQPLPNGFKPTSVTPDDADAAYADWKTNHLEDCTGGVFRTRWETDKQDATVSEGIGYGMLLTVAHDEQAAFDGLWNYYKKASQSNGLMNWLRYGCDAHRDTKYGQYPDGAATDADLDAAMALIMAKCRWGTSTNGTD